MLAAAPAPPAASPPSIDVEVTGQRLFYGSQRGAQLTYVLHGPSPAQVVVEVVRTADGVTIARWTTPAVAPETPQTVSWDGMAGGRVQREGRYQFRVSAQDQAGATATTSQVAPGPAAATRRAPSCCCASSSRSAARTASAPAPRRSAAPAGIRARTRSPPAGRRWSAARGGTVQFAGFQSAAGNYLVVDGEGTDVDYVYMHLRDAALAKEGERVYTGQLIGYVGDTGDAQGCHLHFEMWSAPGWYARRAPFDPLPSLQAWDRHS